MASCLLPATEALSASVVHLASIESLCQVSIGASGSRTRRIYPVGTHSLGNSHDVPIDQGIVVLWAGAGEERNTRRYDAVVAIVYLVKASSFHQGHGESAILRQALGHGSTSGTSSHDDIVEGCIEPGDTKGGADIVEVIGGYEGDGRGDEVAKYEGDHCTQAGVWYPVARATHGDCKWMDALTWEKERGAGAR